MGWDRLKFSDLGVFKSVSKVFPHSFEMGLLHPKTLSLVEKFCQTCPHEWKTTRTDRRISDRRNIVTVDEGCEFWLCVLSSCQFFIFSSSCSILCVSLAFSFLTSHILPQCVLVFFDDCMILSSAFSPLIRFVCLLCTKIFLQLNFLGWFWSLT